jgi:hypothetical protein
MRWKLNAIQENKVRVLEARLENIERETLERALGAAALALTGDDADGRDIYIAIHAMIEEDAT